MLPVKNLYFDAGFMIEGDKPIILKETSMAAFAKNPTLSNIQKRVAYLNQYDQPADQKYTDTYDPYLPGKKRTWVAVGFNLVGQEIVQPDGSKKLYFTKVQPVNYELGNNVGKPAPKVFLKSYSRNGFVNPKDIDWMYDVNDFMHPGIKP